MWDSRWHTTRVKAVAMKPNFALSMSSDGIGLLHRTAASQWHLVGEVALDSADLSAELAALREKAAALEPSGLTTKLVIPDAQIRYLDLPAAEAPDADHEAAAMRALDGATPYALDDLAFDWNVAGGRLHVAAVARETLQEAEDFAREHRFNPVSFVARPEATSKAASFGTEPFFGETAQDGGRVVRDRTPIEIAGAASVPKPRGAVTGEEDPAAQHPVAAPPAPDRADRDRAGQGAEEATGSPALAAIRAASEPPETGAPQLAGAERPSAAEAPQASAKAPDPAAHRGARPDRQEPVANPASAAASLAPRREEPPAPDPAGKVAPALTVARPRDGRAQGSPHQSGPSRGSGAAKAAGAAGAASDEDEADRLTIFGARETQRRQRGKPRFLGLILTALLLLCLAGVAAWATIYPDSDLARLVRWSEPQIAVTPESPEITQPDAAAQATAPAAAPAPAPAEAMIPPRPGDAPAVTPDPVPEPLAQTRPLTTEEARAAYAETGIWQIPPDPPLQPDAGSLDEFYLTSIDEDLPVGDAVALPDVAQSRTDTRPETLSAPAPPGTTFALDARGLVEATPEGALTPDGVEVRAGPPPVRPPQAPARVVPVPGLTLAPEAAAELDRISDIRPRTRPDNLIERHERGALGGRSLTELASLRPQTRPATVPQQASVPAAPDASAVEAALAEAAETIGPDEEAMSQAVTASLKPRKRPGNLQTTPQSTPQTTVRREAPQTQTQPQRQTAAPRIPSSASVARAATTRNAVNLRQVNLIGVYGSPSNRRALVRLSNGRYQKVEVGDRLDGGQVSAIGASELRYTKRGRPVVLRMPSG